MKKTYFMLSAKLAVACLLLKGFDANAQGFNLTSTSWQLPVGGEKFNGTNYSFRNIAYNIYSVDDDGSQSWTVMDMNGDGKTDLVVYAEKQSSGIGVFSLSSNPHWKVYLNTGSGFSSSATDWALPAGGQKINGINRSFRGLANTAYSSDDIGSQSWALMDVDGDSKPDLVVYAENQSAGVRVFGTSSSRYWKVYLNTGTGFSATATTWSLPTGGKKISGTSYSFLGIANTAYSGDDTGSQSWTLMDMDADGKPDLVVYAENQAAGVRVYTISGNPNWKVFLNTGSGFSATATNWRLPAGGQKLNGTNYSFNSIANTAYSSDDTGSQSWLLLDIDGDLKTDLVVYSENQSAGIRVFGSSGSQYWKAYLNTGTGFSTSATNWSLPAGGEKYGGTAYSFRSFAYTADSGDDNGSQSWVVTDIDGDSKTDLVVYAQKQGSAINVFSPASSPYWKAYLNTGTGFSASATDWPLPAGGEKYSGTDFSFRNFAYNAGGADDAGSQSWIVLDMDGDRKSDLVVYSEIQNGDAFVFSPTGSGRHWNVYLNATPTTTTDTHVGENSISYAGIYPNPTQGQVNVKISSNLSGQPFSVTDQAGRVVLTGKLNNELSTVDLSPLARGIYFMQIGAKNERTLKLIKE